MDDESHANSLKVAISGLNSLFCHFLSQDTKNIDQNYPSAKDGAFYTLSHLISWVTDAQDRLYILVYREQRQAVFEADKPSWLQLTHSWLRLLERRLSELSVEENLVHFGGLPFPIEEEGGTGSEDFENFDDSPARDHLVPLITTSQIRKLIQNLQGFLSGHEVELEIPLPDDSSSDHASISSSFVQDAVGEFWDSVEAQYHSQERDDQVL